MATERLFHTDAYLAAFSGRVLTCAPAGQSWAVVLDRTAFYAESGGQPSDLGTLGGCKILAVHEGENGSIVHTVDGRLEGDVEGRVDWDRRLDHMEQHTGQHLLSGAFERRFGAETLSWHLGAESCTVDLAMDSLTDIQAGEAEAECNQMIRAGLSVVTHVVESDRAGLFPMRRPPKVVGDMRVVEIDGYDWSACGGTHLRSTSEMGLLKIKSWERYKKGTRVEFLAGRRAMADYAVLDRLTRDLCRSLSIAVGALPGYVGRSLEESVSLRKQLRVLQEQMLEIEANQLIGSARKVSGTSVVRMAFGGRPLEEVRLLAAKVANHSGCVAVFGTRGAVPHMVMHRSVDLRLDVGAILREVLPTIEGKGGGSPLQAQGGGSRPEALEQALDLAVQRITQVLRPT